MGRAPWSALPFSRAARVSKKDVRWPLPWWGRITRFGAGAGAARSARDLRRRAADVGGIDIGCLRGRCLIGSQRSPMSIEQRPAGVRTQSGLFGRPSRPPPPSWLWAPSIDLNLKEARARRDPPHQLRRVAICSRSRPSSEATLGMCVFSATQAIPGAEPDEEQCNLHRATRRGWCLGSQGARASFFGARCLGRAQNRDGGVVQEGRPERGQFAS